VTISEHPISPFTIAVADDVLDDLTRRLAGARFATYSGANPWEGGVTAEWLRGLVDHWQRKFDWRTVEARLNAYPQFLVRLDDRQLHFVHVRGERNADGGAPVPLVLSHGWPSSFAEMLRVVGPLTDPLTHGLDASTTFDVVIPSLPGFTFSQPMREPFTRAAVGELWHRLMTEVLGYDRFALFGGDIGGGVSRELASRHPDSVLGLFTNHAPFPGEFDPPPTPAEQAYLDAVDAYDRSDGGYSEIMRTRPHTLAAALVDSPVGLAAWIADKLHDWTDHDGDFEAVWDSESLLTLVTLYWVTGCIGTSFLPYFHHGHNGARHAVTVPTGVLVSAEPSEAGLPRSIVERAATDLRYWREAPAGGHFIAFERPALVVEELRSFFGALRG